MGSHSSDKSSKKDESPQRKITISPFWMGACEMTHDAFDIFLKDEATSQNNASDAVTRPSPQYIDLSWGMGKKGGFPANSMQQRAALMFCRWLYKKTGIFYRLPTEAEWEYAARAGSSDIYYYGNDSNKLDEYAWYSNNSDDSYHKTGQKKPNAWGLYDMLGNLSEWTLDQYDENYFTNLKDGAKDPIIKPSKKQIRTVRGGSFESSPEDMRLTARQSWKPSWNKRDPQIPKSKWWLTDAPFVGFRVVRPFKQPTTQEAEAFFSSHLD